MDALLAKILQGVDPNDPDASWQVFRNLMALVPWGAMVFWTVVFMAVGALLGWWRGRTLEGLLWATLLGPIGWIVILVRPRPPKHAEPPALPR